MIRFEIKDNGQVSELAARGDPDTLAVQFGVAIMAIYTALHHTDDETAEEFRDVLTRLIQEGGAAWEPDVLAHIIKGQAVTIIPPEDTT